jgi:hypothetical protein
VKRLALASLVFVALALSSCGRPGLGDLTVYTSADPELAGAAIDDGGVWSSSPWACSASTTEAACMAVAGCSFATTCTNDGLAWIPYRPHEQVQVAHSLTYTPALVMTYISFVSTGETPSLAAGDLTRIVEVDDATITVWNDTNGSYFVRVVAY